MPEGAIRRDGRELIDGTYLPGAYAEFFIPALPSREQIRAEISAEAAAHPELVQEIARQREALMMRMGMRG